MQTILLNAIDNTTQAITTAAALLQNGELVAFPTETVYGLGARVFDAEQVQKIFTAKMRPQDNPLIAHIASVDDVQRIARTVPQLAHTLMQAFFPGPLTLVLPKHPNVPALVSAGLDSIAFRMPAHPVALALIRAAGQPLVAPSANLSGKPSPTTAQHAMQDMNGRIAAILDGGRCEVGIESTVLSLLEETPRILRPGAITAEQIEEVLRQPIATATNTAHQIHHSPGMKYRHYAPATRIRLVHDWAEVTPELCAHSRILATENPQHLSNVYPLSMQTLYAEFRHADETHTDEIIIILSPDVVQQEGLMNRIRKATE